MSKLVYCITSTEKWNHSKTKGEHIEESLETEGFIHCSYTHQLAGVANKYFKGMDNLTVLCINPDKLGSPVVSEDLSDLGESYPHIYGSINTNAVEEAFDLKAFLND